MFQKLIIAALTLLPFGASDLTEATETLTRVATEAAIELPAPDAANMLTETEADPHAGHDHAAGAHVDSETAETSPGAMAYPVIWTHGCGWTATYYVCPGRINWFHCYGCGWSFYIYG